MNIQVNGKQINIGDSLRTHAEEKTLDLLSKYSRSATDLSITFSKDRYEYICDISLHLSTGLTAQSRGRTTDIYECFDSSLEKIAKQYKDGLECLMPYW